MKKIVKTILCALLSAVFVLSCVACKGPVSDDDAQKILADLLEKEVLLNKYVYADGFVLSNTSEYEEHKDDATYYYSKVSKDSPFLTINDLKKALEEVYTEEVLEEIYVFAFNGSNETEGVTIIPRFYQKNGEERMSIDVTSYGVYDLRSVIKIDTAVVKRSTSNLMEVTVSYRPDLGKDLKEMSIQLRKIDGEWKLDSRTWAVGVE